MKRRMVGLGTFKVPERCKLCELWGEDIVRRTFQPYWMCSHACIYCYAKYGYRWTYWAKKSDTMKAVDLVQARKDYLNLEHGTQVEASSSCDAFDLRFERKFGVTKEFLKEIVPLRNDIPFTWVTKSHLIGEYVDILPRLSVPQVTIDSYGKKCKMVASGASVYEKRVQAVKKLSERFKVGIRIDPIIPDFDSMQDIEAIFSDVVDHVDHVTISIIKFKKKDVKKVTEKLGIPPPTERVGKEFWYAKDVRREYHVRVKELCNEHGITFASCREDILKETGQCDPFHLLGVDT